MASPGGNDRRPTEARNISAAAEDDPGGARAPYLLGRHLLGVARLAVVALNGHGRVSHWSRTADELFGVRPGTAVGRAVGSLLRLPTPYRPIMEPGAAACGTCAVPRADTGAPVEIAWWAYPVGRPDGDAAGTGGVRLLAFAMDLARFRDGGLDLGLDDLTFTAPAGALRHLAVTPVLAPGGGDGGRTGARLAELLPLVGLPAEPLLTRALELGHPAVDLAATVRLPVVPHTGGAARAVRLRPAPAAPPAPRRRHRPEARAAADRFARLAEAAARIDTAADVPRALAEALVPDVADAAGVRLVTAGVAERVAHAGEVPGGGPNGQVAAVLATGRAHRGTAADGPAVVPLTAHGRTLGTVELWRGAEAAAFDDTDLALAGGLARHAALALDEARLRDREARTVRDLQRALLPDAPPAVAGAEVCLRYRPAAVAERSGGDWYDAIALPGGRVGVLVGDVLGPGLAAAAAMGRLRAAFRTLARLDPPPGRMLAQLDEIAAELGGEHAATCLYAVYDPIGRCCALASAGHLPPVLVTPEGGARVLDLPVGPPVGAGGPGGASHATVEVPVADGSRLALCTDGLLTGGGRAVETGLEELRARMAGERRPLADSCDGLLAALAAEPADDAVLALLGCDGIPQRDMASWQLEPDPSMVPRARAQAAAQLAAWGLADLTDTVQLLVSELVTNALVHGAGAIGMRLVRMGTLRCEVHDDGPELPRLCQTGAHDESGRGLQLVSHLAERWGTDRTDRGKVVWFEHALPDPGTGPAGR
ncbi:SpoIIE family protein phosphatase [Actinomadura parmotrematis]|uniref:SpoIIE family protein phosphatase n=1 Tax=Actinomadura parmotrematis TaxID=2864039 RepID=A0ABS7G1V1_9ACTN|nr:SpoIIE family protein phosphatase [Actinomadura parmotrematis]MBW8485817.1 SpoIIE family protein phosphatase [Actinomadura parmotrematis]